MKTYLKQGLIVVLLLALFFGPLLVHGETTTANISVPADFLLGQIEVVLKRTRTPGEGVAIVHRESPEWVASQK